MNMNEQKLGRNMIQPNTRGLRSINPTLNGFRILSSGFLSDFPWKIDHWCIKNGRWVGSSKAERSMRQCQSSAVRVFGANRTPQAPMAGGGPAMWAPLSGISWDLTWKVHENII